jgi:hypothetical protein
MICSCNIFCINLIPSSLWLFKKLNILGMNVICLIFIYFFSTSLIGQNKFEYKGGIDVYFGLNPMDLKQQEAPLYVSSNKLNNVSVNLGLIELKYSHKDRFRLVLSPAFGTYMNSNYASEKQYLRWVYEAFVGFSLRKKKSEWIDFGVFSSPFTFETPKSWDQLAYSRSLAPEFVPYFVSGIRYQNEFSKQLKLTLFLLNGWQKIELQKKIPSFGTQLEWRKRKEYVNWTTYAGNEKSELTPNLGFRFFTEWSWAHETDRFRTQACFYTGLQQINENGLRNWWQINGVFDYKLGKNSDTYIRYEYFHDPYKIQIQTPSNAIGFMGHATSLGFNHKFSDQLYFRFEAKNLFSRKENELFFFNNGYSNYLPLLFANVSILF